MPTTEARILKIVKILLKIAYERDENVRKICDVKWKSRLDGYSIELVLKKTKNILSLCAQSTLRTISNHILSHEYDGEIVSMFVGVLKKSGQEGQPFFKKFMDKFCDEKCKFFFEMMNFKYIFILHRVFLLQ